MNTPDLDSWKAGRYPSPAYLEGYYSLPDGSLSGEEESMKISLGKMNRDIYMGYLGQALSLASRKRPLSEMKRNNHEWPTVKRNETKQVLVAKIEVELDPQLCECGCLEVVKQPKSGRKRLYATSSCRLRVWRRKQ